MGIIRYLFGDAPPATSDAAAGPRMNGSHAVADPAAAPGAGHDAAAQPAGGTTPNEGEQEMTPPLITAENVSVELLKQIFEAAFVDYSMTDKGDIRIKDQCTVLVFPRKEQRLIKLMTVFGFKASTSMLERLECANKINVEYIIVRASVVDDTLYFEHDLLLDGGLSPKGLVWSVKRFDGIPYPALREHGADLLE